MWNTEQVFWFADRNDSVLRATAQEREEAISKLVSQGSLRGGYYLLLALATLIVTPGLLLDNVSVVIGGMILAPLLVPLLSLSLSIVTRNVWGFLRSLRIIAFSIVMVVVASALMTLAVDQAYGMTLWYPHDVHPGIYVLIAFCSGTAGAFAWVKRDLAPAIAGVAIAVSLLPPLCLAGIGLALIDMMLFRTSITIFAANLLGITLAASLVFLILGFLTTGRVEQKILEKDSKNGK